MLEVLVKDGINKVARISLSTLIHLLEGTEIVHPVQLGSLLLMVIATDEENPPPGSPEPCPHSLSPACLISSQYNCFFCPPVSFLPAFPIPPSIHAPLLPSLLPFLPPSLPTALPPSGHILSPSGVISGAFWLHPPSGWPVVVHFLVHWRGAPALFGKLDKKVFVRNHLFIKFPDLCWGTMPVHRKCRPRGAVGRGSVAFFVSLQSSGRLPMAPVRRLLWPFGSPARCFAAVVRFTGPALVITQAACFMAI